VQGQRFRSHRLLGRSELQLAVVTGDYMLDLEQQFSIDIAHFSRGFVDPVATQHDVAK